MLAQFGLEIVLMVFGLGMAVRAFVYLTDPVLRKHRSVSALTVVFMMD